MNVAELIKGCKNIERVYSDKYKGVELEIRDYDGFVTERVIYNGRSIDSKELMKKVKENTSVKFDRAYYYFPEFLVTEYKEFYQVDGWVGVLYDLELLDKKVILN